MNSSEQCCAAETPNAAPTKVFYVFRRKSNGDFLQFVCDPWAPLHPTDCHNEVKALESATQFKRVSVALRVLQRNQKHYGMAAVGLQLLRVEQTETPGTPTLSATLEPVGKDDYFVITHVEGYVQRLSNGGGTTTPTWNLERAQHFSSERDALTAIQQLVIDRARYNVSYGYLNLNLLAIRRVTPGTPTTTTKVTVLE